MRLPADLQAVLLDVGGVFHLPDHGRIADAMARAGVDVDPADLDRAHYAGVKALTRFTEGDRAIWLAYNRGYAHALGADERVEEVSEVLLSEFTTGGVWTRVIPGSPEALRAIAATGVKLAIVSNADGSVEAQLAADGICQMGDGPGVRDGRDPRLFGRRRGQARPRDLRDRPRTLRRRSRARHPCG